MKKHIWLAAFLLSLLFSANIFAGDYAKLNFIGFSKDGKYLAFEEYGTQDGSGFPYSNIYFVDVAKNTYAAPPIRKRIDNEQISEAVVRRQAKALAAANLRKFNIIQANIGELVVARLITDLDANKTDTGDGSKAEIIKFTDYRTSSYFLDEFELALKPAKVEIKSCKDFSEYGVFKFDLTLKNLKTEKIQILQSDKNLPEARYCPLAYSIQNIYVYENSIATFINVYTVGFEGPDMRFMVVTGTYKSNSN